MLIFAALLILSGPGAAAFGGDGPRRAVRVVPDLREHGRDAVDAVVTVPAVGFRRHRQHDVEVRLDVGRHRRARALRHRLHAHQRIRVGAPGVVDRQDRDAVGGEPVRGGDGRPEREAREERKLGVVPRELLRHVARARHLLLRRSQRGQRDRIRDRKTRLGRNRVEQVEHGARIERPVAEPAQRSRLAARECRRRPEVALGPRRREVARRVDGTRARRIDGTRRRAVVHVGVDVREELRLRGRGAGLDDLRVHDVERRQDAEDLVVEVGAVHAEVVGGEHAPRQCRRARWRRCRRPRHLDFDRDRVLPVADFHLGRARRDAGDRDRGTRVGSRRDGRGGRRHPHGAAGPGHLHARASPPRRRRRNWRTRRAPRRRPAAATAAFRTAPSIGFRGFVASMPPVRGDGAGASGRLRGGDRAAARPECPLRIGRCRPGRGYRRFLKGS